MKLFKRFVILTLFLVILLSNAPSIVFAMQNEDINDLKQLQNNEETEEPQNDLSENKVNKYEESYNQNTIGEIDRKVKVVSSENEQELTSTKYVVDKQNLLIKKILPETDITYFKTKFNVPESDVKVYEDTSCTKEVTSGIVATEMAVKIVNTSTVYRACVIGDFNNDGKMAEIELNQVIKHVAGLKEHKLTGLDLINADVNYDGKVDQIDITIIIRWIVYKELNIPAPPIIEVVNGEKDANGTYISDVTVRIREGNNEGVEVQKTTYSINYGEEIEIKSGETITLTKNGEYKIIAYTYLEEGIRSRSTLTIKIERSMDKVTVNLDENEFTYDGTAKEPAATVKDGTKTLVKDVNYTVSYSNNINAGTATVTITGKGEYTGSKTVNFTINKAKNPISVTGKTGLAYNGSEQELVTVTNVQGKVYYSTDTVLTSSNYTSGSTSIPTGTEADLYMIYYYTPGNNNYSEKSGSTMVAIVESVAKIGTVTFQSLQSAVNEVPTNNVQTTITMLKDTSECVNISENKNIMLDLANYTVTNGENEGVPTITSNGTLTVKGGTITSVSSDTIHNYGILNINDTANITNTSTSQNIKIIKNFSDATLNISGGTVTAERALTILNCENGAATITGGKVSSANINNYTIINEGTLEIGNSANITNTDKGDVRSTAGVVYNAQGATSNIIGGTITATNIKAVCNYGTAKITGGTIKSENCASIDNLGIANISGGTITSDTSTISNQGTLDISDTAYIATNGSNDAIYNYAEATTNISGGTIINQSTTYGQAITNSGILNISNKANIISTSQADMIRNSESGILTISGVTITSENNMVIVNEGMLEIKNGAKIISNAPLENGNECYSTIRSAGTTIVSGGTITSKNGSAINNEGTLEISGTANIETTSTVNFSAVYNDENATANISGGTITSTSHAVHNNGTLNVSGTAKIETTSTDKYSLWNTGTATITGGTITSENSDTIESTGTLNISDNANIVCKKTNGTAIRFQSVNGVLNMSGGTVTSLGSYCIWIYEAKSITITGGTIDGSSASYAIYKDYSCTATISVSGATIKGGTYGI